MFMFYGLLTGVDVMFVLGLDGRRRGFLLGGWLCGWGLLAGTF